MAQDRNERPATAAKDAAPAVADKAAATASPAPAATGETAAPATAAKDAAPVVADKAAADAAPAKAAEVESPKARFQVSRPPVVNGHVCGGLQIRDGFGWTDSEQQAKDAAAMGCTVIDTQSRKK